MDDIELDMLIDRKDPVQKLVNHDLDILTTIYFIRQKQGNIGMAQTLIERQLKIGRVIKGLNFPEEEDREVTEILTIAKHADAIIEANDAFIDATKKFSKPKNILDRHIPDCNPYQTLCNEKKR